jgi:hypothetical protein
MPYPSSTTFPSSSTFPGTDASGPGTPVGESGKIVWSNAPDRIFETGLDRGVLYPKDGPAVAWNGLTSVDENGGESATPYYVDGRPFLILPKPKEFAATLKALTYPDEFAALMGYVEAVDGMYLDSQMGDSFGLSYRTLIGNAIEGETFGYKIHLIYNATVSPPASSYQSLSDSINPTEFSWDIQAVPVAVPGYRATAHITIDTRHMDPAKLRNLEAMLYGTGNSYGFLPDPTTILDMLSFGDTIIIIDNGDGTWTAKGSYKNIYLIGDGIFQIDNVDAVDHGDGTYTVSTTNA